MASPGLGPTLVDTKDERLTSLVHDDEALIAALIAALVDEYVGTAEATA